MKEIPTGVKWLLGAVMLGGLAYVGQWLISKYVIHDKTGETVTGVPAMPPLFVTHNAVQTDDYTIRWGNNYFYYSLGDQTRTDNLDNIWKIKFETVQGTNKLQLTAYQNNNPVFTQVY